MVLADEPTASLDKASGREVVDRMQALAREHGTTILLVTHDNRILDVADRILHLEDGRLSTFTEAVIANTQHMMHTLAESTHRQHLEERVAGMDEAAFRRTLQEVTQESQRFLEATALARDEAFRSMLEQALRVFTRRVGELLNAERASLFLVDRERQRARAARRPGRARGRSRADPARAAASPGAAATSGKAGAGGRRLARIRASTPRWTAGPASAPARCCACRCTTARARCSPSRSCSTAATASRSTSATSGASRSSRLRSACCSNRWSG